MLKRIFIVVSIAFILLVLFSSGVKSGYSRTIPHIVGSNETLWSIAKLYNANKETRQVVEQIRKINGCTPIIHIGQVLEIPIWD